MIRYFILIVIIVFFALFLFNKNYFKSHDNKLLKYNHNLIEKIKLSKELIDNEGIDKVKQETLDNYYKLFLKINFNDFQFIHLDFNKFLKGETIDFYLFAERSLKNKYAIKAIFQLYPYSDAAVSEYYQYIIEFILANHYKIAYNVFKKDFFKLVDKYVYETYKEYTLENNEQFFELFNYIKNSQFDDDTNKVKKSFLKKWQQFIL